MPLESDKRRKTVIRLDLGAEPQELKSSRDENLPLAIAAFNLHGTNKKAFTQLLDSGYQIARTTLRDRQHGKCAFCEKSEDAFKRPVEHFRPKKSAQDKVGNRWTTVKSHYWWMTWSWSNLYFACDRCNMSGRKGSRFPIEPGSVRIPAPSRPHPQQTIPNAFYATQQERRLLVDPRVDNPLEHIQWIPVDRRKPKGNWTWTLEGRDAKGEMTIDVLKLVERVDEVNRHLKGLLFLWLEIDDHLAEGRSQPALRAWNRLLGNYIDDPAQPFRNAAWWALDSLCSVQEQRVHGLPHPTIPEVR